MPDPDPLVGVRRSVLAVPLKVKNRIIGQIRLDHDRPGFYTQRHADLILAVASQAAIAIENARLFEEAERRRRELEALYGAEEALHRSLRREDVLEALVDVAAELLGSDKTAVLVWDEHHEALVVGAARGFSPEAVARMRFGPGEGLSWHVATDGQPIAVEDVAADSRVAHHIIDPEGVRSMLEAPIKIGAEVVGVFGVNYVQPRHFTGDEERLLVALAQRAGLALENANLFEGEQQLREPSGGGARGGADADLGLGFAHERSDLVAAARSDPRSGAWRIRGYVRWVLHRRVSGGP